MKEVVQGAKGTIDISLGTKGNDGVTRPFDLTGHTATTPKICWKAGVIKIEKELTDSNVSIIGADTAGQIQGILTPTETATFPEGEIGDVEIIVDKGGTEVTVFQLLASWRVIKKICD
jgi:hypothetical protein